MASGLFGKLQNPQEDVPVVDQSLDSGDLDQYFKNEKPVIIRNATLIQTAANKWTPDFLATKLTSKEPYTCYQSDKAKFQYHDVKRDPTGLYKFTPPTRSTPLKYKEFLSLMRDKTRKGYVYFQDSLTSSSGPIVSEMKHFDYEWITDVKKKNKWGPLTTNMLLIAPPGCYTPAHFDEQENIFCQLSGHKRFYLFSPAEYERLVPYPLMHPCDRQAQVDLYQPDLKRFPRFLEAKALVADLQPGDILYIPSYWWHHVESLDVSVSLTFWFKASPPPDDLKFPLSQSQVVALTRNIERVVHDSVPTNEVDEALLAICGPSASAKYQELGTALHKLLAYVMEAKNIDSFLKKLMRSRYDLTVPRTDSKGVDF